MKVSDEKYQNHTVFADLEQYAAFYEQLAMSVFGFVTLGTRGICNIDSYVFSSIQGTLESIHSILRDGRINDAYALLRKYYDSAIINIYTGLYLEENFSVANFTVSQIDKWVGGRDKLPKFGIMSQYIRRSQKVAPITDLLFFDDRYRRLRDRCNDHTHYNFYQNVLLNDKAIFLAKRGQALEEFSNDVRDVFMLHLAYMFFANNHYMMSSDYVDCLDCGMPPEPDSQYWVAAFVQSVFNHTIKQYRPDIASVIKCNTSMHLS